MKKILALFVTLTIVFALTTLYLSTQLWKTNLPKAISDTAKVSPNGATPQYPYPFAQTIDTKSGLSVDPVPYRNALYITYPGIENLTYEESTKKFLAFGYKDITFLVPESSVSAQIVNTNDSGFLPGIDSESAVINHYEGNSIVNISELKESLSSGIADTDWYPEARIYTSQNGWKYRLRAVIVPGYVTFYAETVIKDKYYLFKTSELFANISPPIPNDINRNKYFWMDEYTIPARENLIDFIDSVEVQDEQS